ncbi:MAG: baseplate J/gp47 family protein [Alphaproteobacteria bacterium]|nr:baseplate J/gp47 family protein [Alphaproteobacteria bacterium]
MTLPTVITAAGVQPTPPADLRAELVALITATNPGFTADLPASLVEDIVSTDTGALVVIDSAKVDLINSMTPYGANEQLLIQLGNVYGTTLGEATNTSGYCVFSGPIGFLIAKGFTVSDGTYQYVVQDGGIIGGGGATIPLYVVASQSGSWSVPANTITQLVTSVPLPYVVTVTNPLAGLPGNADGESYESFRARTLDAGLAASMGMASYLKTLLKNVNGVQQNLVAVQQQSPGWKVICGGGDPYQVAYAIFTALFDITSLVGSLTTGRNITVSINDFPDTYQVVYVNPPQEVVTMNIGWRSTSPNYVDPATVAALVQTAEAAYVNALIVGQPMNLLQIKDAFLQSLPTAIPQSSISILNIDVYINGVLTPPASGTGIISGDAESYFYAVAAGITVTPV